MEGRCRQWIRDGRIDECLAAIHEVFEQMEEPGAAELTRLQTDVLEFILPLYEDIESGQDYLTRYFSGGCCGQFGDQFFLSEQTAQAGTEADICGDPDRHTYAAGTEPAVG